METKIQIKDLANSAKLLSEFFEEFSDNQDTEIQDPDTQIKETQSNSGSKIKVAFYLSKEDHGALMEIYIKRLQAKIKTDKSQIVSEAIRLLYKKEMK